MSGRGGTWRGQGRTITLPVRVTDAEMAAAVFTAQPPLTATCLTGTGLRPLTVACWAFRVLMLLRHGAWMLGGYDEVGFLLHTRGLGGRLGLDLVGIPVTASSRANSAGDSPNTNCVPGGTHARAE